MSGLGVLFVTIVPLLAMLKGQRPPFIVRVLFPFVAGGLGCLTNYLRERY